MLYIRRDAWQGKDGGGDNLHHNEPVLTRSNSHSSCPTIKFKIQVFLPSSTSKFHFRVDVLSSLVKLAFQDHFPASRSNLTLQINIPSSPSRLTSQIHGPSLLPQFTCQAHFTSRISKFACKAEDFGPAFWSPCRFHARVSAESNLEYHATWSPEGGLGIALLSIVQWDGEREDVRQGRKNFEPGGHCPFMCEGLCVCVCMCMCVCEGVYACVCVSV